jgi:hypothetical protein
MTDFPLTRQWWANNIQANGSCLLLDFVVLLIFFTSLECNTGRLLTQLQGSVHRFGNMSGVGHVIILLVDIQELWTHKKFFNQWWTS